MNIEGSCASRHFGSSGCGSDEFRAGAFSFDETVSGPRYGGGRSVGREFCVWHCSGAVTPFEWIMVGTCPPAEALQWA